MSVIAVAKRVGNLYYLECQENQCLTATTRRFGHLGEHGLTKLAKNRLIKRFNYDSSKGIGFCEPCMGVSTRKANFLQAALAVKNHLV